MSRWRDVKQKKVDKKKLINFVIPSLSERIKAFITDTFMILMPLMYVVFYLIMGSREEFEKHMLNGWLYIFVPHFILTVSFWFFSSQTPGYKAYDIEIVSYDSKKPSIAQLVFRYLFFTLSLFSIFGLFLATIRTDKKNLHDILSRTMLVKKG